MPVGWWRALAEEDEQNKFDLAGFAYETARVTKLGSTLVEVSEEHVPDIEHLIEALDAIIQILLKFAVIPVSCHQFSIDISCINTCRAKYRLDSITVQKRSLFDISIQL